MAAPAAVTAAAADLNALGTALLAACHAPPPAASLSGGPDGTFVSPLSVGLALALLLEGATPGSQCQRQLQALLLKASAEQGASAVSQANGTLLQQLQADADATDSPEGAAEAAGGGAGQGGAPAVALSVATSVWAKPPLQFQAAYLQAVQGRLRASAHALTGAAAVNEWVSRETRGRIEDLVDEGAVARAVAVLATAVYFKGSWLHAFPAASTAPGSFLTASGREARAAMMHKKFAAGTLGVVEREGEFRGARLPYRGGRFAAVALLPDAGAGPGGAAALAARAAREGGAFFEGLRWASPEVLVWLPRFKLETSLKLKGPLQKLGLTAAFEPSKDFGAMLEGEDSLLVDEVLHKVFVEVNEEGTEAAAATAIMMQRTSMPLRPPPELRFDRPFVFGVQHAPSGALLFLGIVEAPDPWAGG